MKVIVTYFVEDDEHKAFRAKLQIFVPALDNWDFDLNYIHAKFPSFWHSVGLELDGKKYKLIQDTLYASSQEEIQAMVEQKIDEMQQFRKWVRIALASAPSSKTFRIE